MKNKKIWVLLLLLLSFLVSCDGDEEIFSTPVLVVEGWIDSDGFPVVILTTTVPVKEEYEEISSLDKYLVKWAKVTVSDGEQEVVLTGKTDQNYFPPYVYTTGNMRGVAGKNYTLTVEYEDFFAQAEAFIPQPVKVDSFKVECVDNDSLYQITACFATEKEKDVSYKFFSFTENDYYPSFVSSYLGVVNGEVAGSEISVPVYRAQTITMIDNYTPYYKKGERVHIKLATLDTIGYEFWNSYEEESSLSRNFLFPVTENLCSNITGGLGYWLGYGSTQYVIEIND